MYKELLEKFGSPLYVYDQNVLEEKCREMKTFQEELQKCLTKSVDISMHYSTKANSNPFILQIVKDAGLKVDCMSPYELLINQLVGFSKEEMLYVCNNIDVEEMKTIYESGVLGCFDSVSQVETWGKNYPGTDIMVRINPGDVGVGHSDKVITAGDTKFGVCEPNFPKLFEVAEKYQLNIIGVHQHLGSLFLNDEIPEYIAGVEAGLKLVLKYFKNIRILDLGGGFGVPYDPEEERLDLFLLIRMLSPILNEFLTKAPSVTELKFEPGRYIPCEAGVLLGTITAVEERYGGRLWIGTNIGMNVLVRPSMYDSYHHITVETENGETVLADFCGNVCESGDVLGRERTVYLPDVGDVVVVHNAGAYGYSMASNYTGRVRPAEVMIMPDGKVKQIRDRENLFDLLKTVQDFPFKYFF